jgi:hypothetical protein
VDFKDLDPSKLPDDALDTILAELEPLGVISPLDYEPHQKQHQFHNSLSRVRLFSGGNRSGKTEAGCLEALFHSTGLYPSWYPKEARLDRHNVGRIVVEDYAKGCGKVLEPKLLKWLPSDLVIRIGRTMKGYIEEVKLRHIDGGISSFDVMTHEQDDGVFEGWSGHWAWFDEPPPKEKWIATKRGLLDFHGRAWFTLTPIKEPWVHEEFVLSNDPDTEHITVDQAENPYITETERNWFQRNMSEEDKDARVHGRFKYLSGRVYKELIPEIHVQLSSVLRVDPRWPTYFVLDPADRRPHRGIWAKVNPFGDIYVIDEIEFTGTVKQVAKIILAKEIMLKINPMSVVRLGDPNKFLTPSALSEEQGTTMKLEFAKSGLYFITDIKDDINLGHLLVKDRLMWDKTNKISSTNHPKLFFIKETTTSCIKQLLTYVWDDYKGSSKDSKDIKQKPKDIHKDFPDCIRYLVVFNPVFFLDNECDPELQSDRGFTGY